MSLGTLSTVFTKVYMALQTIEPKGGGSAFLSNIGWLFQFIWQGICLGIYNLVRWLLALVDFMQYFVQKLIGLDYWLNRTSYTLEGAIEADIIFGFLYSDTVQKVFRAIVAVFFVLLIIFTIYAIIKNEWEHINGTGQGGKFGDGVGNSKTKIFKHSMKAIALVFIFPLVLMIGLLSANAILASLIKALNIGTSSTLGGQLFQIASQNANKFEKYAHDPDGRTAVADEVTFYIKDGKYISLSPGPSDLVESVSTYADFQAKIQGATKYSVNSVFEHVNIGGPFGFDDENTFSGFIAKLTKDEEPFFVAVYAGGSGGVNDAEAYYYYLKCVLQVPIVSKNEAHGFESHESSITGKMITPINGENCYISDLDLTQFAGDAVCEACWNTWNYASIYEQLHPFEDAESYVVERSSGGSSSLLSTIGLGDITNAKVMYNSPLFSTYFDGGQFGVVQMQSEYLVMAEVIDFICQNNFKLHILDITSPMIDWKGYNGYQVESKWIGWNSDTGEVRKDVEQSPLKQPSMPFVISYSDACNETEMGNVLYFGERTKNGNELRGAKYIMCIKVEGAIEQVGGKNVPVNSKYIPLVHNRTYYAPDGQQITFTSSYYASSYQGVVLAKGFLDSGATNAYRGEPTYFVSGEKNKETGQIESGVDRHEIPYYYDITYDAIFTQYVNDADEDEINRGYQTQKDYKISSIDVMTTASDFRYEVVKAESETQTKHEYYINKVTMGDSPSTSKVTPTAELMQNVTISMENDGNIRTATYRGIVNSNNYLFSFIVNTLEYYFFINANDVGKISILSYNVGGDNNSWKVAELSNDNKFKALTYVYSLNYQYKTKTPVKTVGGVVAEKVTANQFEYAGKYGEDKNNDGKPDYVLFQTIDMWSVIDSSVGLDQTMYFNVVFDTSESTLINVDVDGDGNPKIRFAKPYSGSGIELEKDPNLCNTAMLKFVFYDFYTAVVEDKLRSFDPTTGEAEDGEVEPPSQESDDYDEWVFTCKVDNRNFDFSDTYMHLYDGKTYVATIYKARGTSISDPNQLVNSIYVLYEDNYYYNIRTQNKHASEADAQDYYKNTLSSVIVSCVRANRSFIFMDIDFGLKSLFSWRFHWEFFINKLERERQGHRIYITQGIQFDYFFEDTNVAGKNYGNSLMTYYIPGKISYWIIVIASSLMIKVLGTAIWGVIKRIYEITLYFLAAPALASTIPLDGGGKFTASIQQPLVQKILGTYGVMLGLNVFFILLYPVRSMSQIFTPADIATSNSYFLKNFFSIFGREFQAKMLNLYVYILFVLVAFTMISTLPATISKMVGGEDIHATGEQTKQQAGKDVQAATDFATGKTALQAGKKAVGAVKDSLPYQAISKVGGKIVGGIKNSKKGVPDEGEDGEGEGGESERDDEDENANENGETTNNNGEDPNGQHNENPPENNNAQQQVQNKIDDEVKQATGGMTYEEAMASGDPEIIKAAMQAKKDVEDEIRQTGTEEEKAALDEMKANEEAEAEDEAEQTAEDKFTENAEQMAEELGGDQEEMQENAAKNLMEEGDEKGKQIFNIVINAKLASEEDKKAAADKINNAVFEGEEGAKNKEAAALSVMSDEEKEAYNNASDEEKAKMLEGYNFETAVNEDGSVSMKAGKEGEELKDVDQSVVGDIMSNSQEALLGENGFNITNADINSALNQKDENGELTEEAAAAQETVKNAMAENIALAINFDDAENDSIASQVVDNVLSDPENEQNGKVIDKAIMNYMNDDQGAKEMFQKVSGLSDDQMSDEATVLKTIGDLREGGNIEQLGITPDNYREYVAGTVQSSVRDGSYKLSAWDLYKSSASTEDVQNYIDKATEDKMVRKNDEAELEAEKSKEIMQKRENLQVAEALGVKISDEEAKNMSSDAVQEKIDEQVKVNALAAAKIDGVNVNNLDALTDEQKEKYIGGANKQLDEARAVVKGEMLFNEFAKNPNGNTDAVQQMFKQYAGINSIAAAKKINNNIEDQTLENLKLQGYSNTEIAMAAKLNELNGSSVNYENLNSSITAMRNNPELLNGKFLEAMKNNPEGGDISKAYAILGGGMAVSEEELDKLAEKTASNGVSALGLNDAQQQSLMVSLAGGQEAFDNMSDEDKEKLSKQANSLSVYEVDAIVNGGKTRQEAFSELRADTKKRHAIDEIMENGDVSTEALMEAAGDLSESDKAYVEKMYSSRMQLVSDKDKAEAQQQAEETIINEAAGVSEGKELSNKEKYAAIVDKKGSESDFDSEVDSQIDAYIKDHANSKEMSAKKKEFMKNNVGVTEDTYLEFLKVSMTGDEKAIQDFNKMHGIKIKSKEGGFVNSGNTKNAQEYAASLIGFESKDAFENKKSEIEQSIVVGAAKEHVEDFEFKVEKQTETNIANKNNELIRRGADERAFAVADRLKNNSAVMKEAEDLYKSTHDGASLAVADEYEKAAFLYTNFEGKLSEGERKVIDEDYAIKDSVENTDSIFDKISGDSEKFSNMYSYLSSYDGDERGNDIAKSLKQKVVESEYDRKQGNVSVIHNPEKMDGPIRKKYEFNKGILQQEMRTNNDVVGNIFKNTTLLGEDSMIMDIAKKQGLNVAVKDGQFTLDGKNIETQELKSKLDNSKISDYMNSHEKDKDKLVALGAQNMLVALDSDTQNIKKTEAVISNAYLRNKVTNETLKDNGLAKENGMLDNDKIKELIKQMLKNEGKEDKANDENYINNNFNKLKTELALHDLSDAQNGNVGAKNADSFINTITKIESDQNGNKLFVNNLNREVTKIIDPSNYDPNSSAQRFFEKRSISEFSADDQKGLFTTRDAINNFNEKGKISDINGATVVKKDGLKPSFVNIDKNLLKPKNNNWHLFESAKNDESIKTVLKSQGKDVSYENVMSYLDQNESAKEKHQNLVYAKTILNNSKGKKGAKFAKEMQDKYQLVINKDDNLDTIAYKISANKNVDKINKQAKKLIGNETNLDLLDSVNNTVASDEKTRNQMKNALVSDEEIASVMNKDNANGENKFEANDDYILVAAQNDDYIKGRLGDKIHDKQTVLDYLNSDKKQKEKITEKAKVAMIRDGKTGIDKYDKADENGRSVVDNILIDKDFMDENGELSENAVDSYFDGMSKEHGKLNKIKRYSKFKGGKTAAFGSKVAETASNSASKISNKAEQMVSYVKTHDWRRKSTQEATKKITEETNADDDKKQETKKNLLLNNSKAQKAIKENMNVSQSDLENAAKELDVEPSELENVKTNNSKLYNKIVSKAKDNKLEQIKTDITNDPSKVGEYEGLLKDSGFVDDDGNVTEKAISKDKKDDVKKYRRAHFKENVNNRVSTIKEGYDSFSSKLRLKTGKYGARTVENIEMFKMLDADASMRDEAKAEIEKEGKTYSYDTAMEYLEKNKDKKSQLKEKAYLTEARKILGDDVAGKDNEQLKTYLKENKEADKNVKRSLKSKDTDIISERVRQSDTLMREVSSSLVTDDGIEEFIKNQKVNIDVSNDDLIAAARNDVSVLSKLGKDASDFDIRAYLAEDKNASEKARLTMKAKVSKVRTDANLKDQFNNYKVDDSSIMNYLADNNIDLGEVDKADLIKEAKKDASLINNINGRLGRKATDDDIYQYLQDKNNAEDKKYLVAAVNVGKARQNSNLMNDIINDMSKKSDATNDQIGRYFSGKKNNNNEHVRYRRHQKPIDETMAYKFRRGLVHSKGIGKFALGLTGVPDAIKAAEGKKGIKAFGAGTLGLVNNTGITKAVKFALKGKSDKWGQSGLSKTAIMGANAVVFKTAKRLPEMCHKYENWNKVIDHKITQVKQDTKLTRKQKEEQIHIYESQKIYLKKPAEYKNMTAEEKNAFDANQDKLKRQAFTEKSLSNYVKTIDRVRLGKPEKLGITGTFQQLVNPIKERKANHLKQLREMKENAFRFRATAAMRNKEKDYGDDFENMARNFLTRKRYFDMMKRYKLKGAIQYQKLSAEGKEKERRKREAALSAQISRINKVLAKKVAKDSNVNKKSFLDANGFVSDIPRYKDGSHKYRRIENALPTNGLGSKASQVSKGAKSHSDIIKIQNQSLNIDKLMNEFIKKSSEFRGSGAEFSKQMKAELAKYGPYIQKIYDKQKGVNGVGSLANSPVAVQQRKIMEGLKEELTQLRKKATSNGKISASKELNNLFVGKTYTGATTKAEIALHKQQAEDINRIVNLIKEQRGHVSYESLTKRLGSTYMSAFEKANPKISSKSEEAKKNMLESFFESKLNQARKQIEKDTKFKADKINLEKLNGRLVNKSEIDKSRRSEMLANAMKTADNPVYQRILKDIKSSSERVKDESFKLSELNSALRKMQSLPKNPKNLNEIIKLEKAIRQSQMNLDKAKDVLKGFENTKSEYEKAFASAQIKQAKSENKNLAYNKSRSSVLDNYEFKNSDGNTISKNSTDGKQVEMLVSRYIQNYRQSIESMVKKMIDSEDSSLKTYINGMSKKFTDDFGRNMSYAKEVKDELTRKIEELNTSTKLADKNLKETLESNVKLLTQSERSLEQNLRRMGVNISSIKLKKK